MKIYRFIIIYIILIVYIVANAKASSDPTLNSNNTGATGLKKLHYNEIYFNVVKRDISFTQDDNDYYFEISQDLVHYFSPPTNQIYNTNSPFLYLSSTNNLSNIYIESQQANSSSFVIQKISENDGDSFFTSYRVNNSGSIIENYTNHSFCFPSNTWWRNSNKEANLISNQVYGVATTGNIITHNYKLSVNKNSINANRYCATLFNNVYGYKTSLTSGGYSVSGTITKCGNAGYIDLLSYTECEHGWVLKEYDDTNHIIECSKCKWEKNEPHLFDITYDKIENNRCMCGINKNVNVSISDNIDNITEKYLSTPSSIIKKRQINRIGYEYLHIEDTEILPDGRETISTISELPDLVEKNSHKYKYIYIPHKYYLKFNKNNNLSLDLDTLIKEKKTMNMQKIIYGKECNINKSEYILNGYNFVGWSVMPDLNTVMFADEAKISNLTEEDNKIINLYPVYSSFSYKVKYQSERTDCIPNITDKIYNYGSNKSLEKYNGYLYNNMAFKGWKCNGDIIDTNNTQQLEKYIYKDNMTLTLYATFAFSTDHNEKADEKEFAPGTIKIDLDDEQKQNEEIIENSIINQEVVDDIVYEKNVKNNIVNDIKKEVIKNSNIDLQEDEYYDEMIGLSKIPINIIDSKQQSFVFIDINKYKTITESICDFIKKNSYLFTMLLWLTAILKYFCFASLLLIFILLIVYIIYKIYKRITNKNEDNMVKINK